MSEWGAWQRFWGRRTFIVDRRLQFGVVLRITGSAVFILTVLSVGLLLPAMREVAQVDLHTLDALETANVILYVHAHLWPAALLCLVLTMIGALSLSHRIAGPLVQVKRTLDALAQGVLPEPVRTRKHDFLKTETTLLNQLLDSLAERVAVIEQAKHEMTDALDSCASLGSEGDGAAIARTWARVHDSAARLHDGIRRLPGAGDAPDETGARPDVGVPSTVPATHP